MNQGNKQCLYEAGSLTRAMKLQDALSAAAIPSKLIKTDSSSRRGCVYSLQYSCAQEKNVYTVLSRTEKARRNF